MLTLVHPPRWKTPEHLLLMDSDGSTTFNGASNVTLTVTLPDAVTLGTHTAGNYVAGGAVAGNGLSGLQVQKVLHLQ